MTPALTFFIGLAMLVLFGWYFATDQGPRKRLLAATLMLLLVIFSIAIIWPPQKKISLGLDIQGGTSFLIRLKPGDKPITKGMLDQAVEVIRKRIDTFGVSEPIISPVANDRILVQIPGLDTAKIQEARDQLSRVAKLEFRLVYPDNGERLREIDEGKQVIPPEYRIETHKHQGEDGKSVEERLLVKKKADLSGDRVSGAGASYEKEGWMVHLRFDPDGAKQFGNITAAHVHHRFAIVLDGVIQSAPVIQDAIYGGDAQITGRFTEEEARGLASVLENPLQTPVSIEEERSVSPTLGLDSIRASILAGLVGLAITLVCVAVYYKIPGLVANLALIINLILLIGALTMFRFVLTLPGIAGIILTIGLSVDANVLIYERLREEMALGKSLKVAINTAYEKAFSSIFDANVTTLITAAILFWKASGPVKGFAIALTLGILASLFTALIVGRNCLGWLVDTGRVKRILIFVTFRFQLSFAVGAIVALLHDVLMTVGVFALFGRELTLTIVGAVLTVAGYSINDTIVVYDRIREGLASGRRGTIEEIMNSSINQTLSRTILTSTVTLIPILCLFLFGGAVLRDFSLAIIIGVVVGTYSSIFIASPIVLWWSRARGGGAASLRREVTQKAATNPALS